MFKKIIKDFHLTAFKDGSLFTFGMDIKDFVIVILITALIFVIGLLQEKGNSIREMIAGRNVVLRFLIYYALIMLIVIFGAYGSGYVTLEPIYASF